MRLFSLSQRAVLRALVTLAVLAAAAAAPAQSTVTRAARKVNPPVVNPAAKIVAPIVPVDTVTTAAPDTVRRSARLPVGSLPASAAQLLTRVQLQRFFDRREASALVRVSAAGAVMDTLRATPDTLTLAPGEAIIRSTGSAGTTRSVGGRRQVYLPVRALEAASSGRVVQYSIAYVIARDGLHYDPDGKRFRGRVDFVLDDSINPQVVERLTRPRVVHLAGPFDAISRVNLEFGSTNQYQTVDVEALTATDTVLPLEVRALGLTNLRVPLPVHSPRLTLRTNTREILGFGLQVVRVTVSLSADAGGQLRTVSPSAKRGTPDSALLHVASGSDGVFELRSSFMGRDSVSVAGEGFTDGMLEMVYLPPTLFVMLALLGGVVGGVLRQLTGGAAGSAGARVLRGTALGLLTGIVAAPAYALGINLVGVTVAVGVSESATFVIAALGAYYGLPERAALAARSVGKN